MPHRILVRAPTWVGDAVMASPALRALRAAQPEAEIAVEGRPVLRDLLRGLPWFDEFLPDGQRGAAGLWARARALRVRRFDWALLLPDSPRAALGPFLAGVPRRVGYARDALRRALLTEALERPRENGRPRPMSTVERYLGLTRHLGCPDRGHHLELAVDEEAVGRVNEALVRRDVRADEGVLVVTPGAAFGPSKRWPPAHFARACDLIARRLGLRPVIAPGPDELALAEAIASRAHEPAVALTDPPLGLGELKALVARSRLLLTNDTGPRHVAVALGCPVIVVMGPTDPRYTAHALERQRVLREDVPCSPCQLKNCPIDHRCLRQLAPERAAVAAQELLR